MLQNFQSLVIEVDGTVITTSWSDTDGGVLRHLQTAVGGYVEPISLAGDLDMWVNEDGIGSLPPNPLVSMIVRSFADRPVQLFFGSAVFTGGCGEIGETLPLSDDRAVQIMNLANLSRTMLGAL